MREIGAALDYSSSSTVHGYLRQLEKLGYLYRDPSKPRALVVAQDLIEQQNTDNKSLVADNTSQSSKQIMLIDSADLADAGDLLDNYHTSSYFTCPEFLIIGDKLFAYIMHDDSMIDIGIYPGNVLLLKNTEKEYLEDGDLILVRMQNDMLTIRTYYKGLNFIRLQPENDNYKSLAIKLNDFNFIAKVVANLQFYQ